MNEDEDDHNNENRQGGLPPLQSPEELASRRSTAAASALLQLNQDVPPQEGRVAPDVPMPNLGTVIELPSPSTLHSSASTIGCSPARRPIDLSGPNSPPLSTNDSLSAAARRSIDGITASEFSSLISKLSKLELDDADGGDSDCQGEEFELHDEAQLLSNWNRNEDDSCGDLHVKDIDNDKIGFILAKKEVVKSSGGMLSEDELLGKVASPPDDYERKAKKDSSEPDFEEVDNPGNWNDFIFRPIYDKVVSTQGAAGRNTNKAEYKYKYHELPTGCTPVPADANGKRITGGWEFFYNGWNTNRDRDKIRSGSSEHNLFPKDRKSSLDVELLKKLGMTKEHVIGGRVDSPRTNDPDALFFLQLLLPIIDPKLSGIPNDPRQAFYTEVTRYSNLYKYQAGIGNGYGHAVKEADVHEYVRFDGCIIRDGVRGGAGAMYRMWNKESSNADVFAMKSMSLERWHQLKRIYKLCNNDTVPKRGKAGYDPCYKYDYIYNTLVNNVIALTLRAEMDLSGDETSWAHGGFGESGAGVIGRIMNKPGVSKGGQTCIVSATHRIRPYWYQHRHRFTPRYGGGGFNAEGPAEVRTCLDSLEKHVVGYLTIPGEPVMKKIFVLPPHITWDNYFSGEAVCSYAGSKNMGLTTTLRRDRLPAGIKSKYLHKKKTDSSPRTKVARYVQPVIAVKNCGTHDIVLTSFQSTSSCNIISVNGFSSNRNFIEARQRGRKKGKRFYVIEQNMARLLYLKTYSRIDSIDHMIKNCRLKYTCWKYWHAPVNHGKALALTVAYDMYLECAEGELDPTWKCRPVDFHTFRDVCSRQMCECTVDFFVLIAMRLFLHI